MRYLVCTVDVDPCPVDRVAALPFLETVDFTAIGLTPEALLYVFAWGFSAVLMSWLLGFGVALSISLIRKL